MTSFKRWLLAATLGVWAAPALATLNVFATVPEWGALIEELGGDKVKVYTATNALQDPHHVEAKPSLMARARGADLVAATGAELGMKEVATLEPKPGVEPTIAHLSEVLETIHRQPVKMVIRAAYQSDRASLWIAERAKINVVVLPFTVGGDDAAKDLFSLFDDTIQRLLKGIQ